MNSNITTFWHQSHTLIIFFAICLSVIIAVIVFRYGLNKTIKIFRQEKSEKFIFLHKNWQKSLVVALILFLLYFVETVFLMPKEYSGYYYHLLSLLIITYLTWLIVQILYSLRDRIVKRTDTDLTKDMNLRAAFTKLNILLKIAVFAVVIIGISLALMTFPRIHQIGISILASAGIAGVIIGFAAQKSLGNLLAGIQIALTQPIRIDDVVMIEGEFGNIEEISLTYVVIRIWDKRRLVVPITYFIEKIFQNWTRSSFELIGAVVLEVDYATPLNEMRSALDGILGNTNMWDGKTKSLSVTDAKSQTLQLRILVSAKDSATLWDLRCYVREQLIEFLQNNYPHCLPKIRLEVGNK